MLTLNVENALILTPSLGNSMLNQFAPDTLMPHVAPDLEDPWLEKNSPFVADWDLTLPIDIHE